jgi:hypothetical protein
MAKSSNKWLERYTDGGLYIPLEGTSYVVRQQISKPRTYGDGGKYLTVNGEYHRVYENAEGDIMVNHPKEDKGKWDTINLTQKAKAKTIAQGIAATKKWHRENPEYANGGLGDGDPVKPAIPQNFVPIKWNAKTQKENELLQKSINERTKNTPEFKKARKLTKEEQDYSDKVKARIENPSADVGILAANMASALTRLQYLTPDEIKKITNNPKATTELAADILGQGLTNELIGGAVTVAPQAIKSVGKYLTEGPLKNAHKLNPWALTESKIVPKPEQLQENSKIVKAGLPNPLAIADRIIPRPFAPGHFLGMEDSWNNYSPLNLIPGYGKKLVDKNSNYPNFVGFRKFGNSIDDVIESQSLRPKGGLRMGAEQIEKEGNWAEPGKTNEHYPGVFEATMNPQVSGSNIKLEKWNRRNGIVGTTKEGNVAIPLTDPGLSFNRRLPFSNRYVPIDKQKLIENKFQLATAAPHLQSLLEKYGLYLGGAGTLGYLMNGEEGAKKNIKALNKYTIDPIIDWSKKQHSDFKKETGIDLINILKTKSFKQQKENGGWLNQYEQGGYADDSAVLNTEGQEVNTMQFALPTVPTFNFGNGNGNGNGDGEDPKDKKKSKDKKTDTRTVAQKRHDALEAAKTKILKTESPENKKKMDMLYSTTIAAENTYGYDPNAYGRKKQTRSPMSIDNIALDELFNPKGEKNRYTLQQKLNFDLLRSLGLPTDKAKLKELLETDDAYAGLGAAKTLYYNEGALKNLPNPTDTAAYINLYLNEYNKSGALKYQKRNELIDNITNKMRAEGKRKTKTIKPVVKNKTTK